jgi:hypothetical protein
MGTIQLDTQMLKVTLKEQIKLTKGTNTEYIIKGLSYHQTLRLKNGKIYFNTCFNPNWDFIHSETSITTLKNDEVYYILVNTSKL